MKKFVLILTLAHFSFSVGAADLLNSVQLGMTFDQIISKLGQPDEAESAYFIGHHNDAIRYGNYWLIAREGGILDCIVLRKGIHKNCGMAGCEVRSCKWHLRNARDAVVEH